MTPWECVAWRLISQGCESWRVEGGGGGDKVASVEVEQIRFPVWLQGTEIREIFRNFKDFCRTFLLLGNNKPNMLDM